MELAKVDGATIEYQLQGSGEAVVLIHGSILCEEYAPLLRERPFSEHHRVLSYHRQGYAGSTHPRSLTIARQSADCLNLMKHVGLGRAHVVGHSYGGLIALQMALDSPAAVQSLALLEPALISSIPDGEKKAGVPEEVMQMYQSGDKLGAMDAFMSKTGSKEYRRIIDEAISPGAFDRAFKDVDTFFGVEVPARRAWNSNFGPREASRIKRPVLSMVGTESGGWAIEVDTLLREWFPQAETSTIPNADHGLQTRNPRAVAEALSSFFARNPM